MAETSAKAGLEVIGAGFGRTGTVSLKKALEILGYDPCYHMVEIIKNYGHVDFWIRLADGEKLNFDDVFKRNGYKASCDNPSCTFWKEQLEQYPDAKVILTVRDPESWYKSFHDTIHSILYNGPNTSFFTKVAVTMLNMRLLHTKVISGKAFNNDLSKENSIKCFNEHNAQVIAECPENKLLVFNVSEGWEPLCKFLGKPVPNEPFPHLNDTNQIKTFKVILNVVGGIVVVACVLPVLGGIYYLTKGCSVGSCSALQVKA